MTDSDDLPLGFVKPFKDAIKQIRFVDQQLLWSPND